MRVLVDNKAKTKVTLSALGRPLPASEGTWLFTSTQHWEGCTWSAMVSRTSYYKRDTELPEIVQQRAKTAKGLKQLLS